MAIAVASRSVLLPISGAGASGVRRYSSWSCNNCYECKAVFISHLHRPSNLLRFSKQERSTGLGPSCKVASTSTGALSELTLLKQLSIFGRGDYYLTRGVKINW